MEKKKIKQLINEGKLDELTILINDLSSQINQLQKNIEKERNIYILNHGVEDYVSGKLIYDMKCAYFKNRGRDLDEELTEEYNSLPNISIVK